MNLCMYVMNVCVRICTRCVGGVSRVSHRNISQIQSISLHREKHEGGGDRKDRPTARVRPRQTERRTRERERSALRKVKGRIEGEIELNAEMPL